MCLVQDALELDHRGDRQLGPAGRGRRRAQGPHAAFEHPRGDEQIRARIGVHRGDLRETVERSDDVGLTFREEDALPVRRVRANANVGRDREIGGGIFHGVDGAGDDVIAFAREQRELILPV